MRRSECEFYLKKKTLLNYSSSATEFNGASPTIFFHFPKVKEHLKRTRTINRSKTEVVTWCEKNPAEFYKKGIL